RRVVNEWESRFLMDRMGFVVTNSWQLLLTAAPKLSEGAAHSLPVGADGWDRCGCKGGCPRSRHTAAEDGEMPRMPLTGAAIDDLVEIGAIGKAGAFPVIRIIGRLMHQVPPPVVDLHGT